MLRLLQLMMEHATMPPRSHVDFGSYPTGLVAPFWRQHAGLTPNSCLGAATDSSHATLINSHLVNDLHVMHGSQKIL